MAKIITEKKFHFKAGDGQRKQRIDVFLTNILENATRSKIQKLIEANLVTVNTNQIKSSYQVLPGDEIDVTIPIAPKPDETEPEEIPLNIIYEDEYLLVVNKAPGMVAHPAYANYTGTLVNALLHHINKLSGKGISDRPGIVHRIDKDTSGLLVVAKDDWTHAQLARQFSNHTIEREYWAVVWGKFKNSKGVIETNIVRSNSDRKKFTIHSTAGKYAYTSYEVINEYDFSSLIKINLKTGRTHQIRVHLSSIKHPVFGDPVYGGRELIYGSSLPKIKARVANLLKMMPRQALHAKTLGFIHPYNKELVRFDSELPDDITQLLTNL